jgi:hypothetical protein
MARVLTEPGEKVRALAQRARPRDLYDVINLFRHGDFRNAAMVIRNIVTEKCNFKRIPFPTFESLAPAHPELVGEWGNMLGHQLPSLPPVDLFWTELPEFFSWLSGTAVPPLLPTIPIEVSATVLRGPTGGIRIPGRSTPFIEVIRFAASNHLLVELDYRDEQGNRRTRPIEAYSLRRTQGSARSDLCGGARRKPRPLYVAACSARPICRRTARKAVSLMRRFGQRTCAVDMASLFQAPLFMPDGIQGRGTPPIPRTRWPDAEPCRACTL